MKSIISILILLFSTNLLADECISEVKMKVLAEASAELGLDGEALKVRLVGGEQYDGDIDSGTIYKDHFGEYFDVFNASDDTSNTEALLMYSVSYFVYSNQETGELTGCEIEIVTEVSSIEWNEVYETYDVGVSEIANLTIPVFIGEFKGDEVLRSAQQVNQDLKYYKISLRIPEVIEISSESTHVKVSHYIEKLSLKVQEALSQLALVDEEYKYAELYKEMVPGDSWRYGVSACYSGNAHKVFEVIKNLSGLYYSEHLTPWGYKYRDHTSYYDEGDLVSSYSADQDLMDSINTVMKEKADLWNRWVGYDETLLISTANTDSGADVIEALIKKCASGY